MKRPIIRMNKSTGKAYIEKQASENSQTPAGNMSAKPSMGPIGYSGLKSVQGYIYEEARKELRWPDSVRTFKKMSYDPTIRSALNMIDLMIDRIEWTYEAPEGASAEVVAATKFLNWNIKNLVGQTWREAIHEAGSYRVYGFHVAEKEYKRVTKGEHAGRMQLAKLSTRSQDTLGEWWWSDDGRELLGVKQDLTRIGSARFITTPQTSIPIPRKKFMLFRFDPQRGNPEGNSPMKGAYIPWKEKSVVEDFEVVGVSKDLGGILNIGIDADVLAKAASNPASQEALLLQQMEKNAMRMTAGELSYLITPIAYTDSGKELFNFKLLGVEGGGKQYSTDEIIRRKQNDILTVFSADVLRMGQDQMGSFALSSNKTSMLANSIEHHLSLIQEVINTDLVPQLLALNGWFFEEDEMPAIKYSDLEKRDLEVLGTFVQKCVASGAMSASKNLDNFLRETAEIPENSYEADEAIPEEFGSKTRSRSSDGLASGMPNGTGDALAATTN